MGQRKFIRVRDGVELSTKVCESGGNTWLVVTHGVGEHLERHSYLIDLLGHDLNIFFYDLRGHGHSGKSAYIADFSLFEQDLGEVLVHLRRRYKMNRYCLFGHSMGAVICAGYLQRYVDRSFYPESVFLSAPPVGFYGNTGKIIKKLSTPVVHGLARFPFSVKLGGMVNLDYLSHNTMIKQEYLEDPLVSTKLHTKLLFELVKASRETFSRPLNVHCPAFVTVGGGDRAINVEDLKDYFTEVEKSFELKVFEGAYHEMHNEIEKYRIPYLEYLKESICQNLYVE